MVNYENNSKILDHKIDFVMLVDLAGPCNPNGDPMNENRPRTDSTGRGEISQECIKRKIRNRLQDAGYPIFVQSADRCTDGFRSLHERLTSVVGKKKMTPDEMAALVCENWMDCRMMGATLAYKGESVSVGIRGPLSIHSAVTVKPIEISSIQITKSANGETTENGKRASDTMGMRHVARPGALYVIKGSVLVWPATKTGFTYGDLAALKEALITLFENDASSARPSGTMAVKNLYWFEHNCQIGQYSSAKVHESIEIKVKDPSRYPTCFEDYEVIVHELPGLTPEIIEGF